MSKKLDEIYNGREIGQYARDHGAETHKVGSYIEIVTEQGRAYVPDSARDMKKPDRELVMRVLKAIILLALVAAVIYVNWGM
jgi:hypothetical protein